jgi:hypothetical protein
MSIERYRRKPKLDSDREDQFAARYLPGAPLDDLIAVARMADGELAEVMFPSYGPVLVVRYRRYDDDHQARTEYETVEGGDWLVYSPDGDFLYDSDEADWRQFYDRVPDGGDKS